MNIILALDFDLTIADTEYPIIKGLKLNAKKVINKLSEEGFYIIINTCRSGKDKVAAISYLNAQGIRFDQINNHHPHLLEKYGSDTRKIAADIYVDDLSLLGIPDDWDEIYVLIHKRAKEKINSNKYYLKDLK